MLLRHDPPQSCSLSVQEELAKALGFEFAQPARSGLLCELQLAASAASQTNTPDPDWMLVDVPCMSPT